MPSGPDLSTWRESGQRFVWEGHQVFVRSVGHHRLPKLLLIHGFPSASWDWHRMLPTLSEHFRCLCVDMLGFGFSDKPSDFAYSIERQADLISALLLDCGIRKVHLLAHDYGDSVAQELLAREQAGGGDFHIASVCLLNGGLFPDAHRPLLLQQLLASPLGPWLSPFIGRAALARSLTQIFGKGTPPSAEFVDEIWTLLRHNRGNRVIPRLLGYLLERRRRAARWTHALQQATVPLKLICGMADPISGAHMAALYRERIADADIHALQEIGHYPQIEASQVVLDSYLAFFRSRVVDATP